MNILFISRCKPPYSTTEHGIGFVVYHIYGSSSSTKRHKAPKRVQRHFSEKTSQTPLTRAVFFSVLKNMNTKQRRRAEILGELENIPFAVQGKICESRKTLASGKVAVYHNLQWWQDGKNHAVHIPEDRLAEFAPILLLVCQLGVGLIQSE